MKKLLSIILVIAVVLSLCTTVFANHQFYDIGGVQESSLLFINGTTATCISEASFGSDDGITIKMTQSLENQGFLWFWGKYDGYWTTTLTKSGALTTMVYNLPKGNYRVRTDFVITTADGATQSFTLYSGERTVK